MNVLFLPGAEAVRAAFEPVGAHSFTGQWRWFSKRWPHALVLLQRGREVAVRTSLASGRGCLEAPWARKEGDWLLFPLARLRSLRRRLRIAGIEHLFAAEEGWLKGGLKRRVVRLYWQPRERESTVRAMEDNHGATLP